MEERVALGFTDTVDYELEWESFAVNSLIKELGITLSCIKYYDGICSLKDLVSFMLYFMQEGKGVGLFISNGSPLFELLERCKYKITLGGTAIRAAKVLEANGVNCNISLSSTNEIIRSRLSSSCKSFCAMDKDVIFPHVVIQYPSDVKITGPDFTFTTPKANRLIFTNDTSNSELSIPSSFVQSLKQCSAFVVSSFELIENQRILNNAMQVLNSALQKYKGTVFYEDACFKNLDNAYKVSNTLSTYPHIHSMNEDEFCSYLGSQIDTLDSKMMVTALSQVSAKLKVSTLLLHTSHYAILFGQEIKPEYITALNSGVLHSSARFGYGDSVTEEILTKVEKTSSLDEDGVRFKKSIEQQCSCYCAPSYKTNTEENTTIGLGDTFVGGFILGLLKHKTAR